MPDQMPTPGMAQFKIYTGALEVITRELPDGTKKKYLKTTASSSIKDLHGDEFTEKCVRKMADSAKAKGMTIFLNHRYTVPEDVFGSTVDSKAVVRSEGAESFTDLDLEMSVNETNDRAQKTFSAIDEGGVRLGVSIGALIKEWHPRDPKDTWGFDGMIIEDVELLEASIVGIPANPRSWVQNAVRAVKGLKHGEDGDETSATLELIESAVGTVQPYRALDLNINVRSNGADLDAAALNPPPAQEPPAAAETTPPAAGDQPADPPTDQPAAVQPPSDGAADGTATGTETTPDASSQDSGASADGDSTSKAVDLLVLGYKAEITRRDAQISQLTKERDEALEGLKIASSIVEKIASLPIGRKTSFAAATNDFRQKLSGVYDDDFLKFLEGETSA